MKKLLIALLTVALCMGFAACGNSEETTAADTTAAVTNENPVETTVAETTAPLEDSLTVGQIHENAFVEFIADYEKITAEDLANKLVALEINQFMGGAMPVDPAYFPGFDNYLVTGYESGAMFMPMMGSIAYVGYVFELADGADADAFVKTLTDNCNPRWQICVTADEVVTKVVGNKVLFLMCPSTYEMPDEAFGGMAL